MVDNPSRLRAESARQFAEQAERQNGMLLLITGMSGIGKTQFLRTLSDQFRRAENPVPYYYVQADRYESRIPYSYIERLLASGLSPEQTLLDSLAQPVDVGRIVLRALMRRHEDGLHGLLLDDMHWADEESVRVLRYVLPRVVQQGVFIAATVPEPLDMPLGQWLKQMTDASPLHDHIELEPLSVNAIRSLAVERFGTSISRRTAQEVLDVTGGTFLGVEAIFDGLSTFEIERLHLTWDVHIRQTVPFLNPFLNDYSSLSEAGKLAVEIASSTSSELSRHDLHSIAVLLNRKIDIAEACSTGTLQESGFGRTVVVGHRLIASAVREQIPPPRAKQIFHALGKVVEGPEAVVFALRGTSTWNEDLAATVKGSISSALDQGHFRLAHDILGAGIAVAPDQVRLDLLIQLVSLHLRNKTVYEIRDVQVDLAALPQTPMGQCLVIVLGYFQSDRDTAWNRAVALLQESTTDPDLLTVQSFLGFLCVMMANRDHQEEVLDELLPTIRRIWRSAPTDARMLQDQHLARLIAPREYELISEGLELFSSHCASQSEHVHQRFLALVERIHELPASSLTIDAMVPVIATAASLGEVELARMLVKQAWDLLPDVERPWTEGSLWVLQVHLMTVHGNLGDAEALVIQAREMSDRFFDVETRATVAALHAWISVLTADETAPYLLAEATRLEKMNWPIYGADFPLLTECEMLRVAEDPTGILEATAPTRTAGLEHTQHSFLTYRAHALIDVGRVQDAEKLIDELSQRLGKTWQETWGRLAWLRARLAHRDGDLLGAAALYVEALRDGIFPVALVMTRMDFADLLAQQEQLDNARVQLRIAAETLDRIGARAYLPQVLRRLERLVEQDQAELLHTLQTLTARESEIARLVADGFNNRQIAERLFVAQATVRFHVSNVLRKLQVGERSDITRLLREEHAVNS